MDLLGAWWGWLLGIAGAGAMVVLTARLARRQRPARAPLASEVLSAGGATSSDVRSSMSVAGHHHLVTILFSDIAGYTKLMAANEALALDVLATNRRIHEACIARHDGYLLREMGDGLLAVFRSTVDAVICAREIQRAVAADGRYQVRIGLHLGEVVQTNGDIVGDAVNLTFRLQEVAAPGAIVASRAVFDNVRNHPEIAGVDLGFHELKHIAEPVHCYEIAWNGADDGSGSPARP